MNKKILVIISLTIAIFAFNCINKKEKSNINSKSLTGNYSLEYAFKVNDNKGIYIQKGNVSPWKLNQDGDNITVEDIAKGYINDSTIVFNGGPLNFGAGYGVVKFKGVITDSTIIGTSTGTYYDPKIGADKFSSATFILRKIH
ncbi:MAG: hypothetical protein HY934_01735 [Candidatus Firestonebacteria bacterium]|nr:hypothetical protein [Candidatus Firestonebacteria bacterium]